jgi:hypothetical protein
MKADLLATAKHFPTSMNHPRLPHGTLALRGRVKGETADRCHLLPLACDYEVRIGGWTLDWTTHHCTGIHGDRKGPSHTNSEGEALGARQDC